MLSKTERCSVLELNNCNIIIPKTFKSTLYLNDKPNIILNKKTLNIDNDNIKSVLFTKVATNSKSKKVKICGYIFYSHLIKNIESQLGSVIFSFSYSNLSSKNLINELSEKLKTLIKKISEIDFYKLQSIRKYVYMFFKRSQIDNLKKILSVFDIVEYSEFKIKEDFYNLNFNKLKFELSYDINKNNYTIHYVPPLSKLMLKNLVYYNGAGFITYDTLEVFENFKLLMYIIYKIGGVEKYHEFNSDFEKYLITNS